MMDRLRRATDVAKFKADQLLRINNARGEILALNRSTQVLRDKIAADALDLYSQGTLTQPELKALCEEVDHLRARIAEKEVAIAAIEAELPPQSRTLDGAVQPRRTCLACGMHAPVQAVFCPGCGQALPALDYHKEGEP